MVLDAYFWYNLLMKSIAKTQNNAMSELKNLVADLQFKLEEVKKESLLKDKVIDQQSTQINSLQHQVHLFTHLTHARLAVHF
jgi:hypothetical protein